MSERETILRSMVHHSDTATLPKNNLNQLIRTIARKFNTISDAFHKWAQP